MEPTLAPDKDCSGSIGGDAVVDDCGYCTGGTTVATFNEYLGCDSACLGTQIDCSGECGGDTKLDCNSACGGNSFTDYFCKENENGTLNLDSLSLECFGEDENGNCSPNTDSCLYLDCEVDTMYKKTVIDCSWNLPICDTTYTIEDEIDKIDVSAFSFNSIGNTVKRYSDNIDNRIKYAKKTNNHSHIDSTMAQGGVLWDELKKLFIFRNYV